MAKKTTAAKKSTKTSKAKNAESKPAADTNANDEQRKAPERRKVQRRRQIDPTTCERDYSADEIEFMQAMDAYKRSSGRMFPTCSEILEVVRSMGYVRVAQLDIVNGEDPQEVEAAGNETDSIAAEEADELAGFAN